MEILLCFIAHELKRFLGRKLLGFLFALACSLAYDLIVETYLNYEALVVIGTFLTDENVLYLFLGILLDYLLQNCLEVVEDRLLCMLYILRHETEYML